MKNTPRTSGVKSNEVGRTLYRRNIIKVFNHNHSEKIQISFAIVYYKYVLARIRGINIDAVDAISGMNLIYTNKFVKLDNTCITPINCFLYKFMCTKHPC
jgi:hypothetical protein